MKLPENADEIAPHFLTCVFDLVQEMADLLKAKNGDIQKISAFNPEADWRNGLLVFFKSMLLSDRKSLAKVWKSKGLLFTGIPADTKCFSNSIQSFVEYLGKDYPAVIDEMTKIKTNVE